MRERKTYLTHTHTLYDLLQLLVAARGGSAGWVRQGQKAGRGSWGDAVLTLSSHSSAVSQ